MRLHNKVALITGAARGIGAAVGAGDRAQPWNKPSFMRSDASPRKLKKPITSVTVVSTIDAAAAGTNITLQH